MFYDRIPLYIKRHYLHLVEMNKKCLLTSLKLLLSISVLIYLIKSIFLSYGFLTIKQRVSVRDNFYNSIDDGYITGKEGKLHKVLKPFLEAITVIYKFR